MFGDFAGNPAAEQFIDQMVAKHGFNRDQLHAVIGQAKRLNYVLRLMDQQAPSGPNGAWIRYRNKFIISDNVQNGVAFWNQYQDALQRPAGVWRTAGDHRRDYWGGNTLGSGNGQNPSAGRAGDALV
ncbi:hypothetical protein E05_32770 [Plautia stali symbiont]|nr:hypothetical protein E05_32770 [Plautia stali symbiont]